MAQLEYVAGLLFDPMGREVALVRKLKPAWQAGRLNAIGGKVEADETPLEAMHREFEEETGVAGLDWSPCAMLADGYFAVHFFAAWSPRIVEVRTVEAEAIERWTVAAALDELLLIPNLKVIIPLALDRTGITKPVSFWQAESLPGEG